MVIVGIASNAAKCRCLDEHERAKFVDPGGLRSKPVLMMKIFEKY